MTQTELVFVVIALIVVALVIAAIIAAKNIVTVPPDRVAVFVGTESMRVFTGSVKCRIPLIEQVFFLDITPFELRVILDQVLDKDYEPVAIEYWAIVSFDNDQLRQTVIPRFLDTDRQVITAQLEAILKSALRDVMSGVSHGWFHENREALHQRAFIGIDTELRKIGMKIDIGAIQAIEPSYSARGSSVQDSLSDGHKPNTQQ